MDLATVSRSSAELREFVEFHRLQSRFFKTVSKPQSTDAAVSEHVLAQDMSLQSHGLLFQFQRLGQVLVKI